MIVILAEAKVSEEVNRKCRPIHMMVQLSTSYTDCEHHNAQHHKQTDRQSPMDGATVQSAKN